MAALQQRGVDAMNGPAAPTGGKKRARVVLNWYNPSQRIIQQHSSSRESISVPVRRELDFGRVAVSQVALDAVGEAPTRVREVGVAAAREREARTVRTGANAGVVRTHELAEPAGMRVDECRRVDDEAIDDAPKRVFRAVLLDLLGSDAAVRFRSAAGLVQ